jgi:hypothetical protein
MVGYTERMLEWWQPGRQVDIAKALFGVNLTKESNTLDDAFS